MYNSELSVLWFFNQTIAAPWLDPVMIALSSVWYWLPVYALCVGLLIWKYKWKGARMALGAIVLVAFSDQLANQILKPLIDRLRPCELLPNGQHVVSWIHLPSGPRWGGSFPSSHAMNNFAVATYFVTIFNTKRRVRFLFLIASLIGISRLYLGLHYPSDVVGGALIGMALGVTFAALSEFIEERLRKRGQPVPTEAEVQKKERESIAIDPRNAPWNRLPAEPAANEKES
jgi:undecaprenyl-diphosphatase